MMKVEELSVKRFCKCGCGKEVNSRYWSTKIHGWVVAQFVNGHEAKVRNRPKIKRLCFACGSTRARLNRNGSQSWIHVFGVAAMTIWYCDRCATKYIWNPPKRQCTIRFRNKEVMLTFNPRTGWCSKCPRRSTDMHHALGYFVIFPWFGIVELCSRCHHQHHDSLRKRDNNGRYVKS